MKQKITTTTRYVLIFGLALFGMTLFPFAVLAIDVPLAPERLSGGFATAPIWISTAIPVAGETLRLFTAVNDISSTTISGTILFLVDGTTVGSTQVLLAPGAAQILSAAWVAVVGEHVILATFDRPVNASGQSVLLSHTIAGPLSIVVAEAPPVPLTVQYLSTILNLGAGVFSGTVQNVENGRQVGANYFARRLGLVTTSTPSTSTPMNEPPFDANTRLQDGVPSFPSAGDAPTPARALAQEEMPGAETENNASVGMASVSSATSPPFSPTFFDRLGYIVFGNSIIFYPVFFLFLFSFFRFLRFLYRLR